MRTGAEESSVVVRRQAMLPCIVLLRSGNTVFITTASSNRTKQWVLVVGVVFLVGFLFFVFCFFFGWKRYSDENFLLKTRSKDVLFHQYSTAEFDGFLSEKMHAPFKSMFHEANVII